jgi:hypothetical protein
MLPPMFGHRPKHKKFNYQFRYYDPTEDERKKQRLKFKRLHKKNHQGRSVILLALGLAAVIWLIFFL